MLENWQSEYLQFTLYILATVWLLQRGSPESKELDAAGSESDARQKVGGPRGLPLPAVGAGGRPQDADLLQLARPRDGRDLARVMVRAFGHRA